jgi:hypothetical protein
MHQDPRQSAEAFVKKYNIRHKLAIATCQTLLSEIRADPVIGKWSLSVIDECWSDEEILEALCCQHSGDDSGTLIAKDLFPSVAEAKKTLRALHRSFLDRQEEICNA